jgi:hypothetical protein
MCISGNGWGFIELSQEIESDLGLRKKAIPEFEGEIIGNTRKDAEKIGFEVVDGNFSGIAAMAARGNEFKSHLLFILDEIFHGRGDFVVQDKLAWSDSSMVQPEHEGRVSMR